MSEIINPRQDTTPEAEQIWLTALRRAPLPKRVEQLSNLIASQRSLMMADLRARYPKADAAELHKRLAARLLPRADMLRFFGWDPEKEGY